MSPTKRKRGDHSHESTAEEHYDDSGDLVQKSQRELFLKIMDAGFLHADDVTIQQQMQQQQQRNSDNVGNSAAAIASLDTIREWIIIERRVRKVETRKQKFAWAHDRFRELMTIGYISFTANEIREMIQRRQASVEADYLPSMPTISKWLNIKRKEEGILKSVELEGIIPEELRWAKDYFDKIMKRDGHLSANQIAEMLGRQATSGTECIPVVSTVRKWMLEEVRCKMSASPMATTSGSLVSSQRCAVVTPLDKKSTKVSLTEYVQGIPENACCDVLWNVYFQALQRFQHENGHTFAIHHPSLGKYVTLQREKFWNGTLERPRREALQKMGFEWSADQNIL